MKDIPIKLIVKFWESDLTTLKMQVLHQAEELRVADCDRSIISEGEYSICSRNYPDISRLDNGHSLLLRGKDLTRDDNIGSYTYPSTVSRNQAELAFRKLIDRINQLEAPIEDPDETFEVKVELSADGTFYGFFLPGKTILHGLDCAPRFVGFEEILYEEAFTGGKSLKVPVAISFRSKPFWDAQRPKE